MSDPRKEKHGIGGSPSGQGSPAASLRDEARAQATGGPGAGLPGEAVLERIAGDVQRPGMPSAADADGVCRHLLAEMAEVYAMAILRDCAFADFAAAPTARAVAGALAGLEPLEGREGLERTPANLFRGPVAGAHAGPFLSQFLLNANRAVPAAFGDARLPRLATPRDLATFVHVDDPCQVYTDAALVMVAGGALLDCGLPDGVRHPSRAAVLENGCAHLVEVLSDIAGRVLIAVQHHAARIRPTGRPEQLAAMITLAANGQAGRLGGQAEAVGALTRALEEIACGGAGLMRRIADQNAAQAAAGGAAPAGGGRAEELNYLVPRPFADDAPLQPSYASGHAVMAGACVTILKAIFEMSPVRENWSGSGSPLDPRAALQTLTEPRYWEERVLERVVEPGPDGWRLEPVDDAVLTVRGELDKLAANIGTARTIAGALFHSDAFQGLRLGERMAVGILEEQMLMSQEPARMRFTSFDGDRLILSSEGQRAEDPAVTVLIAPSRAGGLGAWGAESYEEWLNRYAAPPPATGSLRAARFNPAGFPPEARRPAG